MLWSCHLPDHGMSLLIFTHLHMTWSKVARSLHTFHLGLCCFSGYQSGRRAGHGKVPVCIRLQRTEARLSREVSTGGYCFGCPRNSLTHLYTTPPSRSFSRSRQAHSGRHQPGFLGPRYELPRSRKGTIVPVSTRSLSWWYNIFARASQHRQNVHAWKASP